MNMKDEELVKMVNPTLKKREAILFFLIVMINGIKAYYLRYWARYVCKGEVKSGGIKIGNESILLFIIRELFFFFFSFSVCYN